MLFTAMLLMAETRWYIGCSGFHYPEWKELFYPKGLAQSRWFEFYAQHFNTLEINNTFYKFPELKVFENWYQKAPPGFTFAVKVPRMITHYKQFLETEELIRDFYAVAQEGLKEKLGPVLFQLPPQCAFSEERLQRMLEQTNMFFINVIEFRNNSWWRPEVFSALKENNVSFCGVSFPGLINDPVSTNNVSYYRFHGVPRLYYSSYEEAFLQRTAEKIKEQEPISAYLYFNNTASAAALENARFVQEWAREKVE